MIRKSSTTTSTVEEYIKFKNHNPIKYENFCFRNKESKYLEIDRNIIWDYMDELRLLAVTVELSDAEYIKYQFKPKLLAYDLYGNPELYFVILALNDICNVKDFSMKKIKLLNKKQMSSVMTYIYNSEKSILKK